MRRALRSLSVSWEVVRANKPRCHWLKSFLFLVKPLARVQLALACVVVVMLALLPVFRFFCTISKPTGLLYGVISEVTAEQVGILMVDHKQTSAQYTDVSLSPFRLSSCLKG